MDNFRSTVFKNFIRTQKYRLNVRYRDSNEALVSAGYNTINLRDFARPTFLAL
jgi:hypothetical protein